MLAERGRRGASELIGRVSIPKLAAASGVKERMLRYIRDGSRQPSSDTAQAILGALSEMLDG